MLNRRRQCDARNGFTLLELLLVLGLLVALAGISWPALRGPAASARLRDAGRQLRAHWAEARLDAMEQGTTFAWRYAPAGSRYTRMPYAAPPWLAAGDDGADLRSNQSPRAEASVAVVESLPETISFAEPDRIDSLYDTSLDSGADQAVVDTQLLDESISLEGNLGEVTDWSDPILFFPDGTTSDSVVVLQDEDGRTLHVALRGITGTASLGVVQTSAEEELR